MKKLMIAALLVTMGIFACRKVAEAPDQTRLNEDAQFIAYVQETAQTLEMLAPLAKGKRDKIPFAKTEVQMQALYGYEAYARLDTYANEGVKTLQQLEARYGSLDRTILQTEINEVLQVQEKDMTASLPIPCKREYYVCLAAATSAAMLCHAECVGLTVGFGTPGCVVLCTSLQVYAMIECMDKWCNYNKPATTTLN